MRNCVIERGKEMKTLLKGIKVLSVAVFVCYFVSMVAGPSYALRGENKGVFYNIEIRDLENRANVQDMQKNKSYLITVLVRNKTSPVNNLSIILPPKFHLSSAKFKETNVSEKNWEHIFEVLSPQEKGEYDFIFEGKDVGGEEVNFSMPMNVVSGEKEESQMGIGNRVIVSIIAGALIIALVIALSGKSLSY